MEITLGKIVSYLVGIPVVLLCLLLTIQTPLGLIPLVLSLLVLPPIRRQLDSRANLQFSRGATVGIGFIAIVGFLAVAVMAVPGGSSSS